MDIPHNNDDEKYLKWSCIKLPQIHSYCKEITWWIYDSALHRDSMWNDYSLERNIKFVSLHAHTIHLYVAYMWDTDKCMII